MTVGAFTAITRDVLVLLLHLWTPVLSTLALAYGYGTAASVSNVSPAGIAALTAGVVLVYTVDRLLESGRIAASLHRTLWVVSGIAVLTSLLAVILEPMILPVQAALGLCSIAYLPLKRVPAAKTVLVAATWWIGCTLLPFHTHDSVRAAAAGLMHPAAVSIGLSVAAGAIMCDYKDLDSDRAAGVTSLPLLVGSGGAMVITSGFSALAAALAFRAGATVLVATAALMFVLGLMPRLLRLPLWGPLIVDAALAVPGIIGFAFLR